MVTLALLLFVAQTGVSDWRPVLKDAIKSVPRIESQAEGQAEPAVCSGAVINATQGYLVTAAHCVDGEKIALTVNGRHAELVRQNRLLDLAIVRFSPKDTKAMKVAQDVPEMGDEIAVVGFAFGSRQVQAQVGRVVSPMEEADQVMRVAVDVIAGDSGGPCINPTGELVGITVAVQHYGPMHLGVVVPLRTVVDFIQPFVETEKPKK